MLQAIDVSVLKTLVLLATTLVAVLLIRGYIRVRIETLASPKVGTVGELAALFQKGQFLRLSTLIIVVVGTIYMSVLGDPPKEVIGLFSAIAGFVLGGLRDGDSPRPSVEFKSLPGQAQDVSPEQNTVSAEINIPSR